MALISSTTGAVVERYASTAFGELTVMNGGGTVSPNGTASANPFTDTGRRYDPETELFYFRARYYDNQTGEFVSRDHRLTP